MRLMREDLVSTATGVGRVEIRLLGSTDPWGTICDDMWDPRDAAVICHMVDSG